jgi:hypothetical protein
MEGHARTWFTPKQRAELWKRWKSGQCVADIALTNCDARSYPKTGHRLAPPECPLSNKSIGCLTLVSLCEA